MQVARRHARRHGQVFEYAKPTDCVVVGMFPKLTEQVREDCALLIEAARGAS